MASAKITQARRMMTQEEIKNHVSPFLSSAWLNRKKAIEKREKKKRIIARQKRLANIQLKNLQNRGFNTIN